ncbi:MAG: hypothetical protein ABW049_13875 [Spongiibacteraceae bacterium]
MLLSFNGPHANTENVNRRVKFPVSITKERLNKPLQKAARRSYPSGDGENKVTGLNPAPPAGSAMLPADTLADGVVLIVGAQQLLSRAAAIEFARAGARVALHAGRRVAHTGGTADNGDNFFFQSQVDGATP